MDLHTKVNKLILPTSDIIWLGFGIDTRRMVIYIENERRLNYVAAIIDVVKNIKKNDGRIRAKELATIAGKLQSIALVVKRGFHRGMTEVLNASGCHVVWRYNRRFDPWCDVSRRMLRDLEWWKELLLNNPKVKMHSNGVRAFLWNKDVLNLGPTFLKSLSSKVLIVITGDAAGSKGWGGSLGELRVSGHFTGYLKNASSNVKETATLWLILDKAVKLGMSFDGMLILYKTDNECAKCAINKGESRFGILEKLARKLRTFEKNHNCEIVAGKIPGLANPVADALSRFLEEPGFESDEDKACLSDRAWSKLLKTCSGLKVEAFACADGAGVRLPVFKSVQESPFEAFCLLANDCQWWFPPLCSAKTVVLFLSSTLKTVPISARPRIAVCIEKHLEGLLDASFEFAFDLCGKNEDFIGPNGSVLKELGNFKVFLSVPWVNWADVRHDVSMAQFIHKKYKKFEHQVIQHGAFEDVLGCAKVYFESNAERAKVLFGKSGVGTALRSGNDWVIRWDPEITLKDFGSLVMKDGMLGHLASAMDEVVADCKRWNIRKVAMNFSQITVNSAFAVLDKAVLKLLSGGTEAKIFVDLPYL